MRTFSRWMAFAVLVCGPAAYADRNDFEISKLGNPGAGPENANSQSNANFQAFARTFGAVISSTNLMPPETTGHAGFTLNAELSVIALPPIGNEDGQVTLPTERPQTDTLLLPSLHIRKGLPFSFEVGARVGWIDRSSMYTATGELKWAVNEGFTWLPDIGVRAHVTRLMGNRDFDLTAAGLDFGVGKQFPLGGMVTLTPYGGIDFVGVVASSDTIDFNQGRSLNSTLDPADPYAGLKDTNPYREVGLGDHLNQRFYGGVRFIGGALQLGAEVSLSNQGSVDVTGTDGHALPAIFAFNATMGLDF